MPRRERVEIRGQVVAAALLAGLDEPDAARVGDALRLQRGDRGERREHRVAVVGAAASVELAVLVAPASTGRGPSRQPIISGCLSRCP